MAAGDIKGEDAKVEVLTGGGTVAKGALCHMATGGEYVITAVEDTGPFAVPIEDVADGVESRFVTEGRVEVTLYGAALKKGAPLEAGITPGTVQLGDSPGAGKVCGTAAEPMDISGNTYTMWLIRGGS